MHKSVLLQEAVELLEPMPGGIIVDATVGAGGHSKEIIRHIGKEGVLIAMDKDESALQIAKESLKGGNVVFKKSDFTNIAESLQEVGYSKVDGIIADLGVSSMQLDDPKRGFSFRAHGKLDMRMDLKSKLTAEEVVNTYSEDLLTKIFKDYGEENNAKKVAQEIVKKRMMSPIIWTDQLSEVVRGVMSVRGPQYRKNRIDPATKIFQALRIEVNGELSALESALPQMVSLLKSNGRLVIISFHSLEDRIVKNFFEKDSKKCNCPPEFPQCICNARPVLKKITKKAIKASQKEISENPRSRSARLRAVEKI